MHRLTILSLLFVFSIDRTAALYRNSSLSAAFFDFEPQLHLYSGNCDGFTSSLGVIPSMDTCSTVSVDVGGTPTIVAAQATCSDDGTSSDVTICFGTPSCAYSPAQCYTDTVSSGYCGMWTQGPLYSNVAFTVTCAQRGATPLFIGVAAGAGAAFAALLATIAVLAVRRRRTATAAAAAASLPTASRWMSAPPALAAAAVPLVTA